jgi:hypothetical protein
MKKVSLIMILLLMLFTTVSCGKSAPKSVDVPEVNVIEVVQKGERIFQIDVNEGADGDYDAAIKIALDAGAEAVSMSLSWDDIETAPGEFNPETNWLEIANAYYPVQDIAVSLVINPIDTNVDRRPSDLRELPYDDVQVIERYNALLDYVHSQIPDLQLVSLSIGNEIDATLGADADEWQQYTKFFAETSRHARSLWPDVPVGSVVMYGGAIEQKESVAALAAYADVLMITYYPLDGLYQVQEPSSVQADMKELAGTFPDQTIYLAEVGYPSSEVNSSSLEKQAEFVHHMFAAWDAHADQIELISFTFQTDLSPEQVADFETYYGYSNKAFAEYLHTLGMRTYNGQDKPAWQQLVAEAEARGW